MTFRVAYEDSDLLVVIKRARLVTTIGIGHEDDTLLNGLMARYSKQLSRLGAARDWGLVHRLDRGTSGVLLVALSPDAYDGLRDLFENRAVRKFYWALCRSTPNKPAGVIKRPIIEEVKKVNNYTSTKTARIGNSGKAAVTAYRVLQSSPAGSLVEARPITGRLHQVRVHLDSIAATVLGDEFYGPAVARGASKRLALHAHRITITHPITGDELDIRTPFPRDLRPLLKRMRLERPDLRDAAGETPTPLDGKVPSREQGEELTSEAIGEEEA